MICLLVVAIGFGFFGIGLLRTAHKTSGDTLLGVVLLIIGALVLLLGMLASRSVRQRADVEIGSPDLVDDSAVQISIPPPISEIVSTIESGRMIDNSCKICEDNACNLIMGCGHMICSNCIELIRAKKDKQVHCPYCNAPIDSTNMRPIFF